MLKSKNNIMDIIRCDEKSYLIWKWRPSTSSDNTKNRENSIRYGSSLRVNQGEVAVFIHNHNNEMITEYIYGPADRILETDNLPVISDVFEKMFGKGTPFQAEVYFINLANSIQLKFGVPFFNVYDHRVPNAPIPIAVRGTITFKIADCEDFVERHGLASFNADDFYNRIRSISVKESVGKLLSSNEIKVNDLEKYLDKIGQDTFTRISEKLRAEFTITLFDVSVNSVEIDICSEEYNRFSSVINSK